VKAIQRTGRVGFVGFATTDGLGAEQLEIAARGNLMDVIMLMMTPWEEKDSKLNRAIDACHKKNIGLVAMKLVAGNLVRRGVRIDAPQLQKRGLSPDQGMLQALRADERISRDCVAMFNN